MPIIEWEQSPVQKGLTMKSLNRWLAVAALGASIGTGPVAAAGQELPPEIQVDLYMVRADRHIQNQEWVAALEALDVVLALQAANDMETPDALWFQHAEVAMQAGYPQTAVASLTRYLVETGREGEYYTAALRMLDEAERRAAGDPPSAAPQPAEPRPAAPRPAAPQPAAPPPVPPPPVEIADPAESEDRFTVLFPLIGMNAATMSLSSGGTVVPDASYLNGISGGGAVAFALPFLDGMFDVQIGAHYTQKGTRVTQSTPEGATVSVDVAFQGLDISALARVSPPQVANLPQLPFYALIGPYASLELDCSVTLDATATAGRFTTSDACANANLDTQPVDFGLSAGLGIEMGSGTTRINVGALYSYGIQDIDKYASETARHRVLNFFAGVATGF